MEIIKVDVSWCVSNEKTGKGNYSASSAQIPGCLVSHDGTFEEFKKYWVESVKFHVECMQPNEIPECLKGEYEFEYEMTVKALLHYYDGILTRAALSRITGINQRQLGHYMTGVRNPRNDKRQMIISGLHTFGRNLLSIN